MAERAIQVCHHDMAPLACQRRRRQIKDDGSGITRTDAEGRICRNQADESGPFHRPVCPPVACSAVMRASIPRAVSGIGTGRCDPRSTNT